MRLRVGAEGAIPGLRTDLSMRTLLPTSLTMSCHVTRQSPLQMLPYRASPAAITLLHSPTNPMDEYIRFLFKQIKNCNTHRKSKLAET